MEQHGSHFPGLFKEFILFIAAMFPIPDYWVTNVSKMFSKLMHPSGGGCSLYQ